MDTLILDQSYLPHRIVGWQKAITMSFTGKVEVVEIYDAVVRSPSRAYELPAVVRLTRPIRRGAPKVRFSRKNVLSRDGHRCQYCGEVFEASALTLDHVVPRSKGGATSWTNIVTACRPCNHRKGDRTPSRAGMTLRTEPVRPNPRTWPFAQLRRVASVPDPWKTWVFWVADA